MVFRPAAAALLLAMLLLYVPAEPKEKWVEIISEQPLYFPSYSPVEVVDGVFTAKVPESVYRRLREAGAPVNRPRMFYPLLDVSTVEIGLDHLANLSGVNAEAVDGRGVLIAVIDTGVDYTHPAFKSSDGRPRILYIWDQTIGGRPPVEFGYGYECTSQEIASDTCPQKDTVGHGTLVASVAAGGAYGEWTLKGVAPGAELIVVKSGGPACDGRRWFFSEKGLLDGISYAVQKASSLGRRLVVALSLGTDIGPHDGSTPLEKALDRWAEQGIVFVVAAGNSANDSRHAEGTLKKGTPLTLRWTVPTETKTISISFVTFHSNQLEMTVVTPTGGVIGVKVNGSNEAEGVLVESTSTRSGRIREILVDVSSNPLRPGIWSLTVAPTEVIEDRWHAWIQSDTCDYESETFISSPDYEITPTSTVTIPGTAKNVLTVGAYTSKTTWTASGRTWTVYGEIGNIEFYSGRGPTIDGRTKPDIVAPGGIIIAAGSKDMPSQSFSPGPRYAVSRGTSMAAPHAAGVAALMLQLAPDLAPDELFLAIKRNARTDFFTGERVSEGSNIWGWGKINAAIAYVFEAEFSGRVAEAQPTLYLNGTPLANITSAGVSKIVLLKNTIANITVASSVSDQFTKYVVEPSTAMVSTPTGRNEFKAVAQHKITVLHPNGSILGTSWQKEGEILDVNRLASLFSLRERVIGYVDENGITQRTVFVEVDRPRTITLLFERRNILIPVLGLLAALILAGVLAWLLLFLYRSSGKKRHDEAFVDDAFAVFIDR
ncbi:MAG: S8 family serine peptidase [Candidatus Caldarchaeum sp.]